MYDLGVNRLMLHLLIVTFLCLPLRDGKEVTSYKCLPEGIELTEVVSKPLSSSEVASGKEITIRQILVRLKSRCRKGKLVTADGREIYLYRLIGCWGNPPEDYHEQLAKQERELEQLRKKFTVIEISCNPPR
jgi:hypothetical protein